MDSEKIKNDFQDSAWDDLADYGKEHPMTEKANQAERDLVGEEDSLSVIRKKRIDWYREEYDPTDEDYRAFEKDEDFFHSDIYLEYRKEEIFEFSKQHDEIYHPSEEEVQKGVLPFMDVIHKNSGELLEIGAKFEVNRELGIETAVSFFSKCFGVEDAPRIEIEDDKHGTDGGYVEYDNTITINVGLIGSQTSTILGVIAHEIWHAHQHVCGDKRYDDNLNNYIRACMDTSGYVNQLVEQEAFLVGDEVNDFYNRIRAPIIFERMMNDTEEIEKWNKRFYEWIDNYKFSPPGSDDDDAWNKMAIARMCSSGVSLDDFSEEDPFDPVRYCGNEEYKETTPILARDDYPPIKTKKPDKKNIPPVIDNYPPIKPTPPARDDYPLNFPEIPFAKPKMSHEEIPPPARDDHPPNIPDIPFAKKPKIPFV